MGPRRDNRAGTGEDQELVAILEMSGSAANKDGTLLHSAGMPKLDNPAVMRIVQTAPHEALGLKEQWRLGSGFCDSVELVDQVEARGHVPARAWRNESPFISRRAGIRCADWSRGE